MTICPFCSKFLVVVKPHIKDKHPEKYEEWIQLDQPPYWMYDKEKGQWR